MDQDTGSVGVYCVCDFMGGRHQSGVGDTRVNQNNIVNKSK